MKSYIQNPEAFANEAANYNHKKNNYKFYLCEHVDGGKIVINEGFEFAEDARSRKKEQELELGPTMKGILKFAVYTGKFLTSKGIDPNNDANWGNPSYMNQPAPKAKKTTASGPNAEYYNKFPGLEQAANDFNPFTIVGQKQDPGYGYDHVYMFLIKFDTQSQGTIKGHPDHEYGLCIWDSKAKSFIEEPADMDDYGITPGELKRRYGFEVPDNEAWIHQSESAVVDFDSFVNEAFRPGRHHPTHAVNRRRNTTPTRREPIPQYEIDHYTSHGIKDMNEPRPTRMAPKPDSKRGADRDWGLYLQDQASDVMIDKYGLEKGYHLWKNSIDQGNRPGGAMFAISAAIAGEKATIIEDLHRFGRLTRDELSALHRNYFERSYFELWKLWREHVKGETRPLKYASTPEEQIVQEHPVADAVATAAEEIPAEVQANTEQPTPQSTAQRIERHSTGKKLNSLTNNNIVNTTGMTARSGREFDIKDSQRIIDMVTKSKGNTMKAIQLAHQMADTIKDKAKMRRRWKAAEDLGQSDIANVFFDRTQDWAQHESRVMMFDTFVNENYSDKSQGMVKKRNATIKSIAVNPESRVSAQKKLRKQQAEIRKDATE